MQVTMAIDYGAARVGTAVSAGMLARPLEVLPHGSEAALIEQLLALAKREMVTHLLVGLPVNADGSEGEQAMVSRVFARRLACESSLPVLLWDEHGSSEEAATQMIASGTSKKARREKLDAVAAAVFLQKYVDQDGIGAERVYCGDEESDA